MRRIIESLVALVVLTSVAGQTAAQVPAADTVHVAPPTGETEADRFSILAALDEVEPGGAIQFGAGTYLVGGGLRVAVPRVTLQGHPDGTTLRGCDPEEFDDIESAMAACNGMELTGERQTVRGLTFEHMWQALWVGCCRVHSEGEGPPEPRHVGGHLVEDNTFRMSVNGFRVIGDSPEPVVVRENDFVNVWHAGGVNGRTAHILDNRISVPEPGQVPPNGFPGLALFITPYDTRLHRAFTCAGNVIAGNRVEGHPEGIGITVFRSGASCRENVIRDNTVAVRRVRVSGSPWGVLGIRDEGDSTLAGVPIMLADLSHEMADVSGFLAEPSREILIRGNLVEGNRIGGAEGVGIELLRASGNRIVSNTMSEIAVRDPFPGNTMYTPPPWQAANGSGIWISPGSHDNQILDNTFEDLAGAAVFVEGDRNVVVTRSADDEVRDLGSGNRVTASTEERRPEDAVESALRAYLDDFAARDPEAWLEHVTDDFVLIENGYPLEPERFTEAWDPDDPSSATYRLHDLEVDVAGEVALYRFDLGWYESGDRVSWGVETGHARLVEGEWRLARNHMTWLPPRGTASPDDLRDYVGEYRRSDFQDGDYRLVIFVEDDQLYMRRPGGEAVAASVGRVRLIPGPAEDQFFAEFVNGEMRFRRDREGRVSGYVYVLPLEVLPGLPDRLESVKVR